MLVDWNCVGERRWELEPNKRVYFFYFRFLRHIKWLSSSTASHFHCFQEVSSKSTYGRQLEQRRKRSVCLSWWFPWRSSSMLLQLHEKSNSTSTKWSHHSPEQCGQAPGPLHVPEINTHHTLALGHPCRRYYKVYDLFLYGKVQEC